MSSVSGSASAAAGASIMLGALGRFIPAPTARGGATFRSVLNSIGGALGSAAGFPGVDPEYTALLQEQVRVQQQMQLVSLFSNIEKSKHETQMVSIRNLRVG